MEPIFETLADKYDLTSPQEVIERLESLEKIQVILYIQPITLAAGII